MIYNTNGPLNPVLHEKILVDRDELGKCLSLLKNSDCYLAIAGPRQFGKTTLLYQIQHNLPSSKYGVAYIDFENMGDYDKTKFYSVVSSNIWKNLRPALENVQKEYSTHKVIDQDGFIKFLIYVSEHAPKFQKIFFLLDEVGGMPREIAWTSFLPSLRSIFHIGRSSSKDRKACSRLRFVFAGSTDLLTYVKHNSPIYNVCERVDVNEFNKDQVLKLVRNLTVYNEDQQKEIAKIVFDWTEGHPYLTQKILSIVDENKINMSNGSNSEKEINKLIESKILLGQDKNLSHLIKTLESKPDFKKIVYPIYKKEVNKKDVQYKEELLTEGLIKINAESHFLEPRNKVYFQAVNSLLEINPPVSELNTKSTIIGVMKNILSLPKYIGGFVLDTFGRHDAELSTKILWGYVILAVTIWIAFGNVDITDVVKAFVDIWRFFFPVK